jgi:hypothetical protein
MMPRPWPPRRACIVCRSQFIIRQAVERRAERTAGAAVAVAGKRFADRLDVGARLDGTAENYATRQITLRAAATIAICDARCLPLVDLLVDPRRAALAEA